MATISTAIGLERISRVSGYKIKKGFFGNTTPNLPQIIAVFGEANTANQGSLSTDKKEITSAKEAAEEYGYGSPIHSMMRILRPVGGEGVGGIPTVVFPQLSDVGATETVVEWTVTGSATANGTHNVVIGGRFGVDFQNYDFSVVKDDTPTMIAVKIADAVNGVLGSPVTASAALGVVTFTTKWKGATSADIKVGFSVGTTVTGVSYSQTNLTAGSGAVDLADSLAQFDSTWYTVVINPYGEAQFDDLEAFNGLPDPTSPTGKYSAIEFKPFVSLFGSTLDDKDDIAAITDLAARKEQVTHCLCPAPKSDGLPYEAAANVALVFARIMQDTPHLTVNNKNYPDMPSPSNGIIGDMSDYNNRDFLVKKGASTVTLENGFYKIQDFVTTYHPDGEVPLQYSYPRNLNLDWNIKDGYSILEGIHVKDHVIVLDSQTTDATNTIKPKQWKAVLFDYMDDLGDRALISDPQFSKDSLDVQRSGTNPNRIETFFRYKRTGIARIESTDVEAGF